MGPRANLGRRVAPLKVGISLFLIADIDSPRNGVILVNAQNLESLASYLRSIEPFFTNVLSVLPVVGPP